MLLIAGASQLIRGVAVIGAPVEHMYGESILYDHAARITRGEPLYQPFQQPPYTVAAYTPVYYILAAGLQSIVGPGFGPGRAVSFTSGLVVAALIAQLAARRTADWRAGLFAAFLFLVLGLPGSIPWSALYKEDMLGAALSIGAISVLSTGTGGRRVLLAAVLAAMAVLTKQILLAAAVGSFVWLLQKNYRQAALFGGATVTLIAAVGFAFELTTHAFWANTVLANVNPLSADALLTNLGVLALYQIGPLSFALVYLFKQTRVGARPWQDLLACFWLATTVPLVGLAKVGSNYNYWIELAAATAVLATQGIWCMMKDRPTHVSATRDHSVSGRENILALLVLLSVASTIVLGGIPTLDSATSAALQAVTERVRATPGAVLADPLDVVVLAGRPILLEPYLFSILEREGKWDARGITRQICAGDVRLLVIDKPLEGPGPAYHGYPHWPDSVLQALRETMVLDSTLGGRYLYVLRDSTVRSYSNVCSSGTT